MVYSFPDLVLVILCWVGCGGLKVVVSEGLYFCVVLLGG